MQAMATMNPVAHATDALRGHVLGTATAADTAAALVAALGLWAAVTAVAALPRLLRPPRAR